MSKDLGCLPDGDHASHLRGSVFDAHIHFRTRKRLRL